MHDAHEPCDASRSNPNPCYTVSKRLPGLNKKFLIVLIEYLFQLKSGKRFLSVLLLPVKCMCVLGAVSKGMTCTINNTIFLILFTKMNFLDENDILVQLITTITSYTNVHPHGRQLSFGTELSLKLCKV
jgi:hypothetical protein